MSIFDIMGPVMIGPSSSHTAGPAKIGRIARLIFAEKFDKINIFFHGSFAETYKGHGTDRAVIGGLLGFKPDDKRLKKSLQIAEKKGINITFSKIYLQDAHPNTILIELENNNKTTRIEGSSIGGGKIIVHKINNYTVNFSATYPTLWILHEDRPGKIAAITSTLGEFNINIAYMQVFRKKRGTIASSVIEVDHIINDEIITRIETIDDVKQVRYIPGL